MLNIGKFTKIITEFQFLLKMSEFRNSALCRSLYTGSYLVYIHLFSYQI